MTKPTMCNNYRQYNRSEHSEEERSYASLCIWECWLEDPTPETEKYRKKFGTVQLRRRAMDLSPTILTIYDQLAIMETKQQVDLGCFDWDLVPTIFSTLEVESIGLEYRSDYVPCGSNLRQIVDSIALKN